MTYYGKPVDVPSDVNPWWLFGQVMNRIQENWIDGYGRKRPSYGTIPEDHYVEAMYADIVYKLKEERRKQANIDAEDATIAHLSDDEILKAFESEKSALDNTSYLPFHMSASDARGRIHDHYRRYHRVAVKRGLK